jgi:hypothetical protein
MGVGELSPRDEIWQPLGRMGLPLHFAPEADPRGWDVAVG